MRIGPSRRIAWIFAVVAAAAVLFFAFMRLHYFKAADLDARPYPMRGIDLEPPAARQGVEYYGKLRLDVYIGADGVVDHIDAGKSTVPLRFREQAAKAFAQTRWEPGRKWGMAVKSLKVVEVDFEPPVRSLDEPLNPSSR
jgi:hypothetical protein